MGWCAQLSGTQYHGADEDRQPGVLLDFASFFAGATHVQQKRLLVLMGKPCGEIQMSVCRCCSTALALNIQGWWAWQRCARTPIRTSPAGTRRRKPTTPRARRRTRAGIWWTSRHVCWMRRHVLQHMRAARVCMLALTCSSYCHLRHAVQAQV